jgi:ABC-type phosphate transport system substrate-binding protein
MFKKISILYILLSCLLHASDIVLVSNINSKIDKIDLSDLKNIYLKNIKSINGVRLLPIDNKTIKKNFDKIVIQKSPLQINSYWAKMIFSGKSQPPVLLESDKDVLNKISNNLNSIGYISKNNLNRKVKLLVSIKKDN